MQNGPRPEGFIGSEEIRQQFLDFFKSRGHTIVPSAPIVMKNDPTLLFTNAGMNQFKDYFLGNKKPPSPRVADTQKCLRVSGKHNDLEEVGVDTYHHTMFEMLGNWSFGDYFKPEAIAWSWELLTRVYGIDKDRLYVSIFEGDPKEGLPKDTEALQEWKKWIPEERIILGRKKDNFWEMGDTGPCGPCTEIHVDCRSTAQRASLDGALLVNQDNPEVIEIWNNVFIQFNRTKDGNLEPLPAKHVDTGLGFERLVRVLQGKSSNYDTDIFSGTIAEIEKITQKKYTASDTKPDIAFRVLSDHIRAISFCIADGQLPSNTGAGYVIRRILRRAVRYYYSHLQYSKPLLHQLVSVIALEFKNVFPELDQQKDFVSKVTFEEEDSFLKTLGAGIVLLDQYIRRASTTDRVVPGSLAFELSDTHGFPIDLTRLIAASDYGWTVDEKGFELELQKQKQRSRAASATDTGDWTNLVENPMNEFVGYDSLEVKSRIVKFRKVKTKGKEAYQIVLEATPFYAESGGQVGDTGELVIGTQTLRITDTKKENNLIIHLAESLPGDIAEEVLARVDGARRQATAVHHTATHLLHAALRQVLGTHVQQKGSLVNEEHLRFDFSHFAKATDEEIKKIEALVNQKIRENIPVVIKEMPKEEALRMGAMALFGEKYGQTVRVVVIDPGYSVELCGGTHVGATGELGYFKIKHEAAVAAGVRRMEAASGVAAEKYIETQFDLVSSVRAALGSPADIIKSLETVIGQHGEQKKKIESVEARQLALLKSQLLGKVQHVGDTNFIGEVVEVSGAEALKKLCFELKNELTDFLVVLAASPDGKASVALMVDERLGAAKNLDAAQIIKQSVAPLIKGGGGGQKTLATAGGQDPSNLEGVIEQVKKLLS